MTLIEFLNRASTAHPHQEVLVQQRDGRGVIAQSQEYVDGKSPAWHIVRDCLEQPLLPGIGLDPRGRLCADIEDGLRFP